MTADKRRREAVKQLGRVVDLRQRELERLEADMAAKQALRRRYLGNIERMQALRTGSGATGALAPELSMNCGAYKQSLLQMEQVHRTDLALHDAEIARTRVALQAAARGHESLAQAVAQRRQRLAREIGQREQKQQDDLATQVWLREQP